MTPIPPPSKSPIQRIPLDISAYTVSFPPSPAEGPDVYSSVVAAWREIRDSVRSQRFKSVTITGDKDPNSALPLKLVLLMEIISGAPIVAGCIRHITVTYDFWLGNQIDPYPHVHQLLNLCKNIQSASFENVRPSRCTSTDDPIVIVIPGLNSSPTITELDLHEFDGTLSELCNFLSEFPDLVKLGLFSYREVDNAHGGLRFVASSLDVGGAVPVGIKSFPNIRVFQCECPPGTKYAGSYNALMDLLGSSDTIFPRLEELMYVYPNVLVRLQRLLDQLKVSLKYLHLGGIERQFISSEPLVLPSHLKCLCFSICAISSQYADQAFYVQLLNEFSVDVSIRRLNEVEIMFFAGDDDALQTTPAEDLVKLDELDDILSSDKLGVERLDLVLMVHEFPDDEKLNWKMFLEQGFPKVLQRFFGKSKENGCRGTLTWRHVNPVRFVRDDELLEESE